MLNSFTNRSSKNRPKRKKLPKQTNNNDLENAYINYHSPWISEEEREHWKKEIKRLEVKQ